MKAPVHYGPRDIKVIDVETPKPQAGEVIIRVRACGICGSDLHEYKLGLYPGLGIPVGTGRIMGHEFSGEVAELGEGVEGLKIGDRVVTVSNGANAEYVKIAAMVRPLILPIPSSLSFEEAATTEPLARSDASKRTRTGISIRTSSGGQPTTLEIRRGPSSSSTRATT